MKSPSFSVRSVAWVKNKRNDESSPRRDLGTRRVKPKGLTSVLRSQRKNMIGYMTLRQFSQPALERDLSTMCLLNFWKNFRLLGIQLFQPWPAAHFEQYLRPRPQVSVFILKIKCSLNLLVSYVCFDIRFFGSGLHRLVLSSCYLLSVLAL